MLHGAVKGGSGPLTDSGLETRPPPLGSPKGCPRREPRPAKIFCRMARGRGTVGRPGCGWGFLGKGVWPRPRQNHTQSHEPLPVSRSVSATPRPAGLGGLPSGGPVRKAQQGRWGRPPSCPSRNATTPLCWPGGHSERTAFAAGLAKPTRLGPRDVHRHRRTSIPTRGSLGTRSPRDPKPQAGELPPLGAAAVPPGQEPSQCAQGPGGARTKPRWTGASWLSPGLQGMEAEPSQVDEVAEMLPGGALDPKAGEAGGWGQATGRQCSCRCFVTREPLPWGAFPSSPEQLGVGGGVTEMRPWREWGAGGVPVGSRWGPQAAEQSRKPFLCCHFDCFSRCGQLPVRGRASWGQQGSRLPSGAWVVEWAVAAVRALGLSTHRPLPALVLGVRGSGRCCFQLCRWSALRVLGTVSAAPRRRRLLVRGRSGWKIPGRRGRRQLRAGPGRTARLEGGPLWHQTPACGVAGRLLSTREAVFSL